MRQYTVPEYDIEDYDNFMNSLNDEKVADILDRISDSWIGKYSFTGDENDFEKYALHMALQYAANKLRGPERLTK